MKTRPGYYRHGNVKRATLYTLRQTFCFINAAAAEIARILREAPLVGSNSVFGERVLSSMSDTSEIRIMKDFQPLPAPFFRFDVELRPLPNDPLMLIVRFAQPREARPYLEGEFTWRLTDVQDGQSTACLSEEINTLEALRMVNQPLHGHGIKYFLFFKIGHARLMEDVAGNIARLLETASNYGS